ncbi:MAG: hypothetical protein KDK62_03830 [Chlamydiia bacterium]|nr:hypothetical protein [Chlamydiia bacterium]
MLNNCTLYAYHHTGSLVLQFVLNDFLMALEEASFIESFTRNETDSNRFYHQLTCYLIKLAGSEQEYKRIFSWIVDAGVLTKLKTNSDLLSEKGEKSDNDYMELHNCAHKTWLYCLNAVDQLRDVERAQGSITDLKEGVEKAITSLHKLKPLIEKIIPKFAQDENVIYFILRHHESFDRHMGSGWTRKLLSRLYPEGIFDFMKERYETRGFFEHIPRIKLKIEELAL